jgi:predicted RNase H-like HicB family nuclease
MAARFKAGGRGVTAAYRIEVYWSAEDGAWIADVPDLAHCSAHGPTPHEAVAQVEVAVEAYLEAARSDGRRSTCR